MDRRNFIRERPVFPDQMPRFLFDLRHGARVLLRTPGVTATALIALALAIGANTAMFSVVDAVLLRPLPFEDPDRLVMVWEDSSHVGFPRNTPAPANWADWRKQNTVFTDIGASRGATYNLTGDGPPERAIGRRLTGNFWEVLKAKPLLGRTFTVEEDEKDAKVAVISYTLWKRRFGADPCSDRTQSTAERCSLHDHRCHAAGVQFSKPANGGLDSLAMTPADLARRSSHYLMCVARLKPGVSVEQAAQKCA